MGKLDKEDQAEIEVTLAKAHTHAGEPYNAGDKIKVNSIERDWLLKHHIIA